MKRGEEERIFVAFKRHKCGQKNTIQKLDIPCLSFSPFGFENFQPKAWSHSIFQIEMYYVCSAADPE
jgi:hypothetical protein